MNGKAFLACVLMSVVLTGCETAKKISQVIRNPDIQVGKLMDQSTELTVTLLREPDFNLLPDTVKTLPPIKLEEKTGYIGVIAYFSDDQATEWKQIESVESIGHHYRLLVHIRASAIEMKKEEN